MVNLHFSKFCSESKIKVVVKLVPKVQEFRLILCINYFQLHSVQITVFVQKYISFK